MTSVVDTLLLKISGAITLRLRLAFANYATRLTGPSSMARKRSRVQRSGDLKAIPPPGFQTVYREVSDMSQEQVAEKPDAAIRAETSNQPAEVVSLRP